MNASLFRPLFCAFSLGLVTCLPAAADVVFYNGTLDAADPTYNRPSSLTQLSPTQTAVFYETYSFTLSQASTLTIRVESANLTSGGAGGANDTFLCLYAGGFTPGSPLINLVAFDDDSGGINLSLISAYAGSAGTSYTVVTSPFRNTAEGTYNNSITTTPIPEPSGLFLIGALGLVGWGVVQRRMKKLES